MVDSDINIVVESKNKRSENVTQFEPILKVILEHLKCIDIFYVSTETWKILNNNEQHFGKFKLEQSFDEKVVD